MDSKTLHNLEQAKAYTYALRMVDAYNIFRRYYDRLPFQPEREHAEYIGLFARVLAELGKEYELNFYVTALEKLNDSLNDFGVKYQLGVIYRYLAIPRPEASRKVLEEILKDPNGKDFHARAKVMLADYYDTYKDDVGACRRLIFSIEPQADTTLQVYVDIWKAMIIRNEGNLVEAERMLLAMLTHMGK